MKRPIFLLQLFYFLCFMTLIAFMCYLSNFFYQKGLYSNASYGSTYSALSLVDRISNRPYSDEIYQLLIRDQSKLALKKIDELESNLNLVMNHRKGSQTELFLNQIKESKKTIIKLISGPDSNAVLRVIKSKINQFLNFVNDNSWKTLSKLTDKLKNKIDHIDSLTSLNLKDFITDVSGDMRMIRNITNTSTLTAEDKSKIIFRLDTLSSDVQLLEKYFENISEALVNAKKISDFQKRWIDSVYPYLEQEKNNLNKISNKLLMFMIAFIVLSFLFLLGGLIFYFKMSKANIFNFEKLSLDLINDIATPNYLTDNDFLKKTKYSKYKLSNNFIENAKRHVSFISKKVNFASYVNQVLPFPSALLDLNAKIIWANDLFLDMFRMDKTNSAIELFSWDHVSRFTNLNGQNPIQDAIEGKVFGLFQVLVKVDAHLESVPYELYVGPVLGTDDKKVEGVMVFLYCLNSMRQSIEGQILSIKNPIHKATDCLLKDMWTDHERIMLRQEFNSSDCLDVFNKLDLIHEGISSTKNTFHEKMGRFLELFQDIILKIKDVKSKAQETSFSLSKRCDNFQKIGGNLNCLNDSLMKIKDLESQNNAAIKTLFKRYQSEIEKNLNFIEQFKEIIDSVNSMIGTKSQIRDIKKNVSSTLSKFIHLIDNFDMYASSDFSVDKKLLNVMAKLKSDFVYIDLELKNLDKKLTQFEIYSSKIDILSKAFSDMFINNDSLKNEEYNLNFSLYHEDLHRAKQSELDVIKKSCFDLADEFEKNFTQMKKNITSSEEIVQYSEAIIISLDKNLFSYDDSLYFKYDSSHDNVVFETGIDSQIDSVHKDNKGLFSVENCTSLEFNTQDDFKDQKNSQAEDSTMSIPLASDISEVQWRSASL